MKKLFLLMMMLGLVSQSYGREKYRIKIIKYDEGVYHIPQHKIHNGYLFKRWATMSDGYFPTKEHAETFIQAEKLANDMISLNNKSTYIYIK